MHFQSSVCTILGIAEIKEFAELNLQDGNMVETRKLQILTYKNVP